MLSKRMKHTYPQASPERSAPLVSTPALETLETSPTASATNAVTSPVVSAVVCDVLRYDTATVQRIIALAGQMQAHYQQTLTQKEIEDLGHEVGIEPQFIRRALAQMAAPATITTVPPSALRQAVRAATVVVKRRIVQPKVQPVQWELKRCHLVAVPFGVYFLLLPFTLGRIDLGNSANQCACLLVYLLVPAVLSLHLGNKSTSGQFGAFIGALTGLVAVASAILNNVAAHHYFSPPDELFSLFVVWIGGCLALGSLGASRAAARTARLPS